MATATPRSGKNGQTAPRSPGRPYDGSYPGLDDKVKAVLCEPRLEGLLARHDGFFDDFMASLGSTLRAAFGAGDPRALFQAHKSLYFLYEDNLRTPIEGAGVNQLHPFVIRIRNEIEAAWERHELRRVDLRADRIPADPAAFTRYFVEHCRAHRLSRHPLFDFLEHRATRRDLIEFFLAESTMVSRFTDLVVLSMVGARDEIRGEMADNFWDEMGRGHPEARHLAQFRGLLRYAGVNDDGDNLPPDHFVDRLEWAGLAGYNLYLFLLLHRRNYFRSLGNIGSGEFMDPAQAARIVRGCHRVGFNDEQALSYYLGHVETDVAHGDGWMAHVMLPLLKRRPEARYDMVLGAEMRMNTAADYYDCLLARLDSGAAGRTAAPALRMRPEKAAAFDAPSQNGEARG